MISGIYNPMNFQRISNKSFIGKLIRLPLKVLAPNTQIRVIQGGLKGAKWIVGSSNHGCWLGTYEYRKQRLFTQNVKRGYVVYDLGAHVGFYSLLASRLIGPEGFVYAFECLPRNIQFLRQHLVLNDTRNVRVFEYAVSDKSGMMKFLEDRCSSKGCLSTEGGLEVKTVKLDELYSEKMVRLPDLLKIDIEGGEYTALLGAENILLKAHPTIFLATHGLGIHRKCIEFLKYLGYEIDAIDGKIMDFSSELIAMHRSG